MKYKAKITEEGDEDNAWWEEYDRPDLGFSLKIAIEQARKTVSGFNAWLRPGEKRRILLDVVLVDENN